ncbi:MAG: flagellar hook-length control protein FliK [Deltaproteobacteria bacterium]|nr:flagellar hook-length control protein FliK [Deltaproteobacteria bacterium]
MPPERLPEAAAVLLQGGFPPEPLERLLTDPRIQKEGLSFDDLGRAWREFQADASMGAGAKSEGPAELFSGSPSPALSGLLELIEQSPGRTLPVPATRQPEIAALLGEAGFTPKQIESLLASSEVQEHGLTAEALKWAWVKALTPSPVQEATVRNQAVEQVTGRPGYHRLWERLRLPVQALPDLRLALQQLGASPEALAGLEDQATPQGLPLGQIWQIIKKVRTEEQAAGSQADAASLAKPNLPASPPSGEELAKWRQLLMQIGFSPDAVEGLLGSQAPASAGELRARLAALAPSAPPADPQDAPKPLYLPESLRLRSMWRDNQEGLKPDLKEGESGQTFLSDSGKFDSAAFLAKENQETFSSLLTLAAGSPAFSGANLGEGIGGRWSPEVRQAFWSQIESAILGNLRPGENRLNLLLNPPHLGRIELIFNLKGEELAVTALMSRPEVAHLAGAGVEQLAQTLSQQGLVLSQFQVQVRAAAPEAFGSSGAQREMPKREQDAGDAARRRRTSRVDRFV